MYGGDQYGFDGSCDTGKVIAFTQTVGFGAGIAGSMALWRRSSRLIVVRRYRECGDVAFGIFAMLVAFVVLLDGVIGRSSTCSIYPESVQSP